MIILKQCLLFGALSVSVAACSVSNGQSLEDFRSDFIAAGGKCSATPSETSTTTQSESVDINEQFLWLESLSCGDDEPSIYRFESERDARARWWQTRAVFDGIELSLGSDLSEDLSILKGEFLILYLDDSSENRADEIADSIGGVVLSDIDVELRQTILSEVSQRSASGGLEEVATGCLMKENLSSDRQSIEVDTEGEEDSDGDLVASAFCLLRATVAPDFIFDSINRTRALDGRIEETYGDYRVSWNYHPDDGLKLTLIFVG